MAHLLTPAELAAQHHISVKSIYRLVAQGKLRAVKLPGSRLLRFDPEKLEPAPRPVRLPTLSITTPKRRGKAS